MNTQQRAAMQQEQEFEDRIITIILLWADSQETDNPQEVGVMRAHIRQVLAEPARTLADPVTDDEIVSPPKEQAMSKNTDLARECGMNAIRGGGWWFETDAQLDDFVERVRADAMLDRHILQADGKHPAPCARFCEATAFKSEIKRLEREALELAEQKTLYALLLAQMKSGAPEGSAR